MWQEIVKSLKVIGTEFDEICRRQLRKQKLFDQRMYLNQQQNNYNCKSEHTVGMFYLPERLTECQEIPIADLSHILL